MNAKNKLLIDCMYCRLRKPSSKEHVIQEGLGGVDYLTCVCGDCNSLLSVIDKGLIVDSPLSLFVRRELGGIGPTIFDIDHKHGNRFLESQTIPQDDAVRMNPQVIFDWPSLVTYIGGADIEVLGNEECIRRFYQRLRRAFGHYKIYGPFARKKDNKGADMIKLVRTENARHGQKNPSRIHTRKYLVDFDHKSVMFELKYETDSERTRVLDYLSTIEWHKIRFDAKADSLRGSHTPQLRFNYSVNEPIQAITKIGLNLLAYFCKETRVNSQNFSVASQCILSKGGHLRREDFLRNGFVRPEDVSELKCPNNSHKFRLIHDHTKNLWKLYAAFFEGKVGAYVEFFGPNRENWATMDVIQPYKKSMRPPQFHNMYLPLDVRITVNPVEILSSVPLVNPTAAVFLS